MSKMARDKGKRGERMIIDWLQPIVDDLTAETGHKQITLQRNTIQSDKGGTDIVGIDWMAAEVKNCEQDNPAALEGWWKQCLDQALEWSRPGHVPLCPVLFYTRNHRPIRVRMYGILHDRQSVGIAHDCWRNAVVDISAEDFEAYFRQRTKAELLMALAREEALAQGVAAC